MMRVRRRDSGGSCKLNRRSLLEIATIKADADYTMRRTTIT
jgi:hypothetical protein